MNNVKIVYIAVMLLGSETINQAIITQFVTAQIKKKGLSEIQIINIMFMK